MQNLKKETHLPQAIHYLVQIQAKNNPTNIAIVFNSQTMCYKELNARSNQFARYLISIGVKPGDIIPIIANKSVNLLVAILGILKARAAYSPLNADSPDKHVESVIQETKARFICIDQNLINQFALSDVTFIDLDNMGNPIIFYSEENLDQLSTPSDLAYIIYTSGTTGNPKGGMITHANLLPTYYSWEDSYYLKNSDIHLQMAPIGFDVFTGDWVRALCSGSKLVLCPKNILIEPKKLYQLIQRENINCAEFVPAILRKLVEYVEKNNLRLDQFRLLVCGSDQWNMGEYRFVKKLSSPKTRVINSYGLTEATIDSTFYEEMVEDPSLNDQSIVPIGKSFKHVNIYLVGEDNQLVLSGEVGEIYIGGLSVGAGYLNQPQLTLNKFVTKNYSGSFNERLYRTGDQGRLLPDGNLLFLGRNQEHIKIHGKRVDLPSLEALLNKHPKIKFNIIIPTTKENSDEIILKCFFTSHDDSLTYEELAHFIRSELPCYYVPREFYQVEEIPLSLNGKVDKRINSQKILRKINHEFHSAQNDIQKYLISLWEEILGIEGLGITNKFHDLGGSSLLFVVMLERVNKQFKLNISTSSEYETIGELSQYIKNELRILHTAPHLARASLEPVVKERHCAQKNDAFFFPKNSLFNRSYLRNEFVKQYCLPSTPKRNFSHLLFKPLSPTYPPNGLALARTLVYFAFKKGR